MRRPSSFAEAAKLFPTAQSALLAQSQLALIRADAKGATEPIRSLPPDHRMILRHGDPWWAIAWPGARVARKCYRTE